MRRGSSSPRWPASPTPKPKRKIIGREFIRVFEQAAREVVAEAGVHGDSVDFLVQGTLYPDVVESGGGTGTANIKSHHNVGGLPDDLQFALVEPLRSLFKDEVRRVGEQLGLPPEIVWRQPFPGPGLGIRIVGEVTADRLEILRRADAIARAELSLAGLDRDIWQCPVVLLADVRSVGVQGDGRTYGHPVVLRPVSQRGRDDGRLDPRALRRARTDLDADHQRGARGEPGRPGRHVQAARHHRVGVALRVFAEVNYSVAFSDDERWANWCADFDEVESEVISLFHTRWMWRAITDLMNNGVPERQYVVVQNYFIRTYVATVCTAIRREGDRDTRTTSLARCLQALVDCPHFGTRTRYLALAREAHANSGFTDTYLASGFDRFAPDGSETVDPTIVEQALGRLSTSSALVKKYTNKVLAHRERPSGVVEELTLTFDDINDALDEIGRVMTMFYSLRHPGTHLAAVTPVPDLQFVEMFKVPWYSQGWAPPIVE